MLNKGFVINAPVSIGSVSEHANEIISICENSCDRYVCVANVHMVITARRDANLRKVMENAFLVTADGLPLVWVLKKQGFRDAERVTGTSLTLELCERAADKGVSVGFYGGFPETVGALKKSITARFPALKVSGYESPPMLPVKPEIDPAVVERLNGTGAGIIFVGLGCPKQEFWMAAYAPHLSAVLVGVGAAFDFIAGTVARAPSWMQNIGLEWLHRLFTEPQKTWKRYAVTNPLFIWLVIKEFFKPKAP